MGMVFRLKGHDFQSIKRQDWIKHSCLVNAMQNLQAMRVVKEVLVWKTQTSFCTIKLACQLTKVKKEVCILKDTNSLLQSSYQC